jgi:hypothetical protein
MPRSSNLPAKGTLAISLPLIRILYVLQRLSGNTADVSEETRTSVLQPKLFVYFRLFRKNKSRLMRSSCCLCVCLSYCPLSDVNESYKTIEKSTVPLCLGDSLSYWQYLELSMSVPTFELELGTFWTLGQYEPGNRHRG